MCQCYDQRAGAPSGVQAALNGPLRVVVRPSAAVDRSGGRSGAPFRRTSVRRRTGAAAPSWLTPSITDRTRVLATVGPWASGASASTRARGGGGDPSPQRDALRLAAPPPAGGSFMWETWSCVGLGSHTPSHIGAVAPGLVWVRAGHHSLVRFAWRGRASTPPGQSPRLLPPRAEAPAAMR